MASSDTIRSRIDILTKKLATAKESRDKLQPMLARLGRERAIVPTTAERNRKQVAIDETKRASDKLISDISRNEKELQNLERDLSEVERKEIVRSSGSRNVDFFGKFGEAVGRVKESVKGTSSPLKTTRAVKNVKNVIPTKLISDTKIVAPIIGMGFFLIFVLAMVFRGRAIVGGLGTTALGTVFFAAGIAALVMSYLYWRSGNEDKKKRAVLLVIGAGVLFLLGSRFFDIFAGGVIEVGTNRTVFGFISAIIGGVVGYYGYKSQKAQNAPLAWGLYLVAGILVGLAIYLLQIFEGGFSFYVGIGLAVGSALLIWQGYVRIKEEERGLGWIFIIIGIMLGLFAINFFFEVITPIFLSIVITFVIVLWIYFSEAIHKKDKWKVFLPVLVIEAIYLTVTFTGYQAQGLSFFAGASSLISSSLYLRWGIAALIFGLGAYLFFKQKNGKTPYRTLGIILVVLALLFGLLFELVFDFFASTLVNSLGVISVLMVVLGLWALFHTNAQGQHTTWVFGLLLFIGAFIFWFVAPFLSSTIFEKYGLEGEIFAEEAGIQKRLERFWFYVQNPDKYFAKFGEFTNPKAKEKGGDVGLKIEKFEPAVSTYRDDQEVKLTGNVKHYALPKFEDGSVVNKVSAIFGCEAVSEDNVTKSGEIRITAYGRNNERKDKIDFVDVSTNSSFFVFCNFKKGEIKPKIGRNETTQKATLSATYNNFITESVLRVYILGRERYDIINQKKNRELEFLNDLRGAASYPGLVNNDRKTISEFSSGPSKLSINVVNAQPLTSDSLNTLFVRSEPNSVLWEGNVKVQDIFLEVPSWFSIGKLCAFEPGSGGTGKLKRLQLKENSKKQLWLCEGNISKSTGCSFFCDFSVEGKDDLENIEEHVIRGIQVSNYTLKKSTTFGIVRSVFTVEPPALNRDSGGTSGGSGSKVEP